MQYLYQEEEMLDESNMEEAKEIMAMFPHGYVIKDNYVIVEDEPDLVECTFIPYTEEADIKNNNDIKNEPEWMREFRLKSFEYFNKSPEPKFGPKLKIDQDSITYYKKRSDELTNDWEKISCAIRNEFKDL